MMELDARAIAAELALEEGAEVVAYCHAGSRSAVATEILRSLGFEARNYVGSWHEWSRHDELPIEA
jgi:thiosulfate/3-mercaptopyruvate sulfurtransferase